MATVFISDVVAALELRTLEPDAAQAADNTEELNHTVTFAAIAQDTALLTVTRQFIPRDPKQPISLSNFTVAIPEQSVVTSFAAQTDGTWRRGRLRPYAEAPFEQGHPLRPWVSLHWDDGPSAIALESPAFAAKGAVRVRYDIWAHAERTEEGFRWVYCPRIDAETTPPIASFSLMVDAPELRVHRGTDDETSQCAVIERPAPAPNRLTARYGRYFLGNVWWWRIESTWPTALAATQGQRNQPKVVLIDLSKSQARHADIAAQLQIVSALMSAAPDALFELVLVDRVAQRVFGRFVSASVALPAVADLAVHAKLSNGSFLDRGIALAADALSGLGKPGQIIALSDGELRSRFDVDATLRQLRHAPKGTVVHLLEPQRNLVDEIQAFEPFNEYDSHFVDRNAGRLAALSGGKTFTVTAGTQSDAEHPPLQQLLAAAVLGQAIQPPAWGTIALRDASRPSAPWPDPSDMAELRDADRSSGTFYLSYMDALTRPGGDESVAQNGVVLPGHAQVFGGYSRKRPPTRLVLSGQAMGRVIQTTVEVDRAFESQLPRLANSQQDVTTCLSEGNHRRVALASGFLAPALEYFVSGTNLSREEGAVSSGSGDDWCDSGSMGGWGTAPVPNREQFPDVAEPLKPCGLVVQPDGPLTATVETRSAEVLDVVVKGTPVSKAACAIDALWSLDLPADFNGGRDAAYTLHLASKD